jgi:hypothetical protein
LEEGNERANEVKKKNRISEQFFEKKKKITSKMILMGKTTVY